MKRPYFNNNTNKNKNSNLRAHRPADEPVRGVSGNVKTNDSRMKKNLERLTGQPKVFALLLLVPFLLSWGSFGHEHINRAAVLSLPDPLRTFFYNHIDFITQESSVPDLRKYTLNDNAEKPRHYIDLENFGPSAEIPATLAEAQNKYGKEFLQKNGILPWYIEEVMQKLTQAFRDKRKTEILFLAADLGHYIGDANMPLHTSANHDGQMTDQVGIHSFWESQLPELFGDQYNYYGGSAEYITDIHAEVWKMINRTHALVDTLLQDDRELRQSFPNKGYAVDASGNILKNKFHTPVHTEEYARAYHKKLNGMIERQLRSSIASTASFWYTAWVNAGKPDVLGLDPTEQTERNQANLKRELDLFRQGKLTDIKSEKEF